MAKPIKFRIKKDLFKIENRCIICGRIIDSGFICSDCAKKNLLKKRLG